MSVPVLGSRAFGTALHHLGQASLSVTNAATAGKTQDRPKTPAAALASFRHFVLGALVASETVTDEKEVTIEDQGLDAPFESAVGVCRGTPNSPPPAAAVKRREILLYE
jgi:hypothetical protein